MVVFQFIAHGHCYLWQQNLVTLHVLSDSAIALAYFSIPITLVYLLNKREDLPFNGVFLLFAGFIISCGVTHLMEVWTLWNPTYWASGTLKALTAMISCATAVVLLRLIPDILAIPGRSDLESANRALQTEVQQRQQAETQIRQLNASLEQRVAERTAELERSRADSERSRQQLRAILDNTTSVVYVKDLEGRLTLINERFTALFDRKPQEMLGMSDFDYLPQDVAEQTRENDQQVLEQRRPVEFEENVPDHGEVKTYISVKFPLYDSQDQPYAVGGISTDITERKRSEMELAQRAEELSQLNRQLKQAKARLETRNRELDQFTYIVSHDLKAPLRGISNLSQWIEEDLNTVLTDETRQEMNLLRDRVHRMDQMIQGLLEYSRVGRLTNKVEPVNVGQLLRDCIDSLDPPSEMQIQVGTMPILETEALPLTQVFMNLISNAIKHHHRPDGVIKITAHQLKNNYEFWVSDDGPGISAANQDRIFNIFETLEASKDTSNTGIGLAIVKKIITNRHGTIALSSETGQGTTFRFTWPCDVLAVES